MPLVNAKCTNCGATLTVDNDKDAAVCQYCNSAFIVEKAINNFNITNNINANVVNIYNQTDATNNSDFLIKAGKLLRYKGNSQEITIPDDVYIIGNNAFKNTDIRKIIFHKGVVSIEKPTEDESFEFSGAFSGCNKLEEVQIQGIKEIPENTFRKCPSLRTAMIKDGVEIIGKNAFSSCDNLSIVSLPSTLKRIEIWAFGWCKSLQEITIPENVQYVACQSFESCDSLSKVVIENGVRTIHGGAFVGCKNIPTIHFPKSVSIENISHLRCADFEITTDNPELEKRLEDLNKKSGCYIATAVYGSYDCPQVWTLRRFRDNTLSKTWYGKLFIRIYYFLSPIIVKYFGKTIWFNNLCRPRLDRFVNQLNNLGVLDTPYED